MRNLLRVRQTAAERPSSRQRAAAVALVAVAACSPIHAPVYPHAPPSVVGRTLTRGDAVADMDALMGTLERVHPDLYAVRSKDAVAADRRRIVSELPDSLSRIEWWTRLAPFMAAFGDGHTNIWYPGDEVRRLVTAGTLVFPHSIGLDDDGHVVLTTLLGPDRGLSRGERVLAINGLNADSLIRSWTGEVSGESDAFRASIVIDAFRDFFVIHGVRAPFAVRVAGADAASRDVDEPGISLDSLLSMARRVRPPAASATTARNFTYRTQPGRIGYMNFRTMAGERPIFESDLKRMFGQLATDSVRGLIVDLRNNGGGDSRMGDALLSHFTTTPYRQDARKDWRMSREYRGFIMSSVGAPLRWLPIQYVVPAGRKMFTGPAGKIASFETPPAAHPRVEPFFDGPVCVLIGRAPFRAPRISRMP